MSKESPVKIVCLKITGSQQEIRALLSEMPLSIESSKREGDNVTVEVFVPEAQVGKIERDKLKVQVMFDASARGKERQKEVGKGNRFEGANRLPKGLGVKTKEVRHELP
jgi:hypothetical protein